MKERIKPIWEQYGISIEEFARAFNEELDRAWNAHLEHTAYLIQPEHPERTMRICNINVDNMKGKR